MLRQSDQAAIAADEPLRNKSQSSRGPDVELVIVGSGFSGLGFAIKLKKAGVNNFVVLERASEVGGVWRDNDWPGLAVDAPIFAYCYEFEPNPEFSRLFPPRSEIKQYADHCAAKYGVLRHLRFNQTVKEAIFDEDENVWLVRTADGQEISTRYLISATNAFGTPRSPGIAGLRSFKGRLIHPATWDYDFDLRGKSVAVIGTGATAVQLVPALAAVVKNLVVYQRTAVWCLPKGDYIISEETKKWYRRFPRLIKLKRLYGAIPGEILFGFGVIKFRKYPKILSNIERALRGVLATVVKDPLIREKLTPTYGVLCKRPAITDDYWPTFNRENVELITEPIRAVTDTGVLNEDGRARSVDAIITATGYEMYGRYTPVTFDVVGRNGVNLGEFWVQNGFQAYEGVAMPGFPNFFMFCGPTSQGGYTYFNMIRNSGWFILRALKHAWRGRMNFIEVTNEAHRKDREYLLTAEKDCAFLNNNCGQSNTYYVDLHGHVTFQRMSPDYRQIWRGLFSSMKDYRFEARGSSDEKALWSTAQHPSESVAESAPS